MPRAWAGDPDVVWPSPPAITHQSYPFFPVKPDTGRAPARVTSFYHEKRGRLQLATARSLRRPQTPLKVDTPCRHPSYLSPRPPPRLARRACRKPAPRCRELEIAAAYPDPSARCRCPPSFWCGEPSGSARWLDWAGERFSAHSFGDDRLPPSPRPRSIPLGRLVPVPTPPPGALRPWQPVPLVESAMSPRNATAPHATRQPGPPPTHPHSAAPHPHPPPPRRARVRPPTTSAGPPASPSATAARPRNAPSSLPYPCGTSTPPASMSATPPPGSVSSPPRTGPTPSARSPPTPPGCGSWSPGCAAARSPPWPWRPPGSTPTSCS